MELRKPGQTARNNEAAPICTEFNLDISKLEVETLLSNPIYRRLYNIVKNDMTRSDLSFRKNLIKELYFLLQITPVMRPQLRDPFLMEVEKMYNLNDYKKIDLASNKLNNLLSIVHSRKQSGHSTNLQRPKTGVTWNQNVSPFLRPYTAVRKRDSKKQKPVRPQSSKFGSQSTKVQTTEEYFIKQFTTNIQEQHQISREFLQKHRTNHPDYQPIYQQLYNILKKIDSKSPEESVIQQHPVVKGTRYVKSAVVRHNNESWVNPKVNTQSEQFIQDQAPIHLQNSQNNLKNEQSGSQSSEEQEYLYVNDNKSPQHYNNTLKIEDEQEVQQIRNGNLKKYTHIVQNKLVQAMREDQEMAQKYVYYARTKSALKREINRRNQSKRLMSTKQLNGSSVKMTNILPQSQKQNIKIQGVKVVDLSKDVLGIKENKIDTAPTYNKRQLLKKLYEREIQQFQKRNIVGYSSSTDAKKPSLKRPLTSYTRFHSPIRFDPLNQENVKQYNAEVLDEIQKIKMKVGGKCYASTQSLMKAMAIYEAPLQTQLPKWQDKSPYYGMVSMGKGKKLKKKGKKFNKLLKSNIIK